MGPHLVDSHRNIYVLSVFPLEGSQSSMQHTCIIGSLSGVLFDRYPYNGNLESLYNLVV